MTIDKIYDFLCKFYHKPNTENPSRFLMHTPANGLHVAGDRFHREAVFAVKRHGDWELGIYLQPNILWRLERGTNSADDLACAAEGVSHFIYLVNRISEHRQCSLLELELQGEVDKFITLSASHRFQPEVTKQMYDILFRNVSMCDDLNKDELLRYTKASFFASLFCKKLLNLIIINKHEQMRILATEFLEEDLKGKIRMSA